MRETERQRERQIEKGEKNGEMREKEREERHVLLSNTLNTFYYSYIGIRHIVKDQIANEIGNTLPPVHGLLFLIDSKGSFICTIPYTG